MCWYGRLFGCTPDALRFFRISLGSLLLLELVLRYRFLEPFYSDEGTLPTRLVLDRVDDIYKVVCLHCHFGELLHQQILLSLQIGFAFLFTLGYWTRITSCVSWYLYFSLTLRNTWMNYILDRYFHHLLFLSMLLPLERKKTSTKEAGESENLVLSPATIGIKALVFWIYLDAGYGKLADPLGGWSYNADPIPALDSYARHTLTAQYLYALLGPPGLRALTPTVVWVELLAAPLALLGNLLQSRGLVYTAVGLICSLHIGIALTLRNSALLSFVACSAWCVFLPIGKNVNFRRSKSPSRTNVIVSGLLIVSIVAGNFWLETISRACDQSVKHIWSTLLHNRWNVFTGAEEYVTWEIAPGQLVDGSVVDVWGRRNTVEWSLPGAGAPCTATSRPGRWRSFPYLAELEGEDGEALWGYLCKEWDRENHAAEFPGRQLVKYNFFMLQADVLPDMAFSATRKRLIHTHECISSSSDENEDASSTTMSPSNDEEKDTEETNTAEMRGEL